MMPSAEFCLVLCAVESQETADIIGQKAIAKRFASAVNTISNVSSIFRWKGAIETANELLMVFYTRHTLTESLSYLIKELHPYELPAPIIIDIAGAMPEVLDWIGGNTAANMDEY